MRTGTVINVLAVVFLGGYAADHVSQPDLFTSAVALDAGAFALVICGIGTL